jgi:PHD/YefM family antitoxin component YafN of YafNO toxin-antitoxin module
MVHETQEPVFLTKDGYGDMVVMSMEAYENLRFEGEVYFKLKEAEDQATRSNRRFSTQEVFQQLMETIQV